MGKPTEEQVEKVLDKACEAGHKGSTYSSMTYDEGVRAASYQRTCRVHVAFNTWVNCSRFLHLGTFQKVGRWGTLLSLPPKDWVFHNNLVHCTGDVFIRGEGETGFRWLGNIFWNP